MNRIHKNGFWEGTEAKSQHCYDEKLSDALLSFFKTEQVKTLCDFGCGMGSYVQHFKKNNLNVSGYDGNPNTPELTNNTCEVLDFSVPIKFDEKFDWVMSLEVGEHLPKKFEEIFINNLHVNNVRGIVLSWAIVGQGGDGHVNCQNNDYIKSILHKLNYINDVDIENMLRKSSKLSWFKNTIMVFRKQ
jgi:cyclopropane fatty-acyl-phospholipid synthase-like methyltransferase